MSTNVVSNGYIKRITTYDWDGDIISSSTYTPEQNRRLSSLDMVKTHISSLRDTAKPCFVTLLNDRDVVTLYRIKVEARYSYLEFL